MILRHVVAEIVDPVHVHRANQLRGRVEGFEGFLDRYRVVHEVQHIGIFLIFMCTVQPAQGLHGLDILQLLVHKHGVQQRLVEAGLILVRHHQHVVHVTGEVEGQTLLADVQVFVAIQLRLGILGVAILDLAGERHHRMDICIPLLLAVLLDLQEVAQGMGTARGDHHGFGLALHGMQGDGAELLHDDFRLLVDDVLVVVVIGFHGPRGWRLLVGRVLLDSLLYLVGHAIRGILQQYVLDKPLFDGL